jgi:hypothetical protein
MCGNVDIGCHIHEGFQAITTNALDQLKEGTNDAALSTLTSLATFWLQPKSPVLADEKTWKDSLTVGFMHDRLLWVTGVVFFVAVLIAGMRTAWEQRARPLQELLKTMLIFVVVAAAGTAVLQLLTSFSDLFAVDIVKQAAADGSLKTAFGGEVDENGNLAHELVATNVPTLLAISIYGSVIIASLIQVVLMLVRSAMLVLLAGTFPLAAAATNTEMGRTWFKKYCGWALAFIAYKPAAALIYAAALQLSKGDLLSGDSVIQAMTGMMMLMLAIFALPALLRFMVPVTAAVAGGAAAMGSSVADPGGLATGAVNVGHAAFGGRSGGGGGTSGGGGSSSGGGGASGAKVVGAAASAGLGAAGTAVNVARKVGGGLAGAAAHSGGEAGGGSVTPTSTFGPMSRAGGGARSAGRTSNSSSSSPGGQQRTPEPAGPSGSR